MPQLPKLDLEATDHHDLHITTVKSGLTGRTLQERKTRLRVGSTLTPKSKASTQSMVPAFKECSLSIILHTWSWEMKTKVTKVQPLTQQKAQGRGAAFFIYFSRTDLFLLKSNISILTTTAI